MEPIPAYQTRLTRHLASISRLELLEKRISWARLATFLSGLALAWTPLVLGSAFAWIVPIPFLAFAWLVYKHAGVARELERTRSAAGFCRDGLARAKDLPPDATVLGLSYLDPDHPYAIDIDLFGRGSLFEKLCRARSGLGQSTLARWLLAPASVKEVLARQEAIRELAPRLDWRETLAVAAGELQEAVDPAILRDWIDRQDTPPSPGARSLAVLLSSLSIGSLVGWFSGAWSAGPFLGILLIQIFAGRFVSRRVDAILQAADRPARELARLSGTLAVFERARFDSEWLQERTSSLKGDDNLPPSRSAAGLERLIDRLEAKNNPVFAPIAALLFWGTHHAAAIERWRRNHRDSLEQWLAAVGELEALASLAGAAFDAPEDSFPHLVPLNTGETTGAVKPYFRAEGLGHPLLPRDMLVRNDLELGSVPGRSGPNTMLWILSGSNMAGKSTLLRALGTNVALAQAGAPVRANAFELTSPMRLGAAIRITDSLTEGVSQFYAEIRRIRQIVDQAAEPGLLYLFDEILHGTNSAERKRGAEAVLRHLVERGALGWVTTHDLALAELADRLRPPGTAQNFHLADRHDAEGDTISFDYLLKDGPVQHGSALDLMRSIGLPV
jgi:hypothetical protein